MNENLKDRGEFAASIPPKIRMEMIQRGYLPTNPEDVERFQNNQQSMGLMKELVVHGLSEGANINSMGEKNMNMGSDMAAIKQAMVEGDHNIDPRHLHEAPGGDDFLDEVTKVDWESQEERQNPSTPTQQKDIRKNLGDQINYTPKNVNEKMKDVLGTNQPSRGPIKTPKKIEEKPYITEAVKATNIGYVKGCAYLNAFIKQLKNPTSEGRMNLIEAMNKMVIVEDEIHPNILHEYRKGVVKAEKELYSKIVNFNKTK